jgi:hypothetical protein
MWATLRRFSGSVTWPARIVTVVVMSALTAAGDSFTEWLLRWIVPVRGQDFVFLDGSDMLQHIGLARLTLVLLPVLGWMLGCTRGFRRGEQSSALTVGVYTAVLVSFSACILFAHAAAGRWALQQSSRDGLRPMVTISSVVHWNYALAAAVVAALVLGVFTTGRRASFSG